MATRSSNGTEGPTQLPDHVVEELWADEHCRRALEVLRDRERPVIVADLAAAVLAAERDGAPATVDDEAVQALRTELYERHIPKLTATGIVAYDSLKGTVELRRPDVLPSHD
ncbi:hypothetical protein ACFQL1_01415 [Halomicroarcula sp. GCM10025709]|uniref:DUF7344 domain-containing protein n=1 Tax=Haloarcula TaxID=2237 RepID=UPI0024C3E3D4|nr:hypothetical protein [Halomicroarcula sp. YJ-61-S]